MIRELRREEKTGTRERVRGGGEMDRISKQRVRNVLLLCPVCGPFLNVFEFQHPLRDYQDLIPG